MRRDQVPSKTAMKVHRCRFLDWTPASVLAMAFHPSNQQLAVARANGDIEMWHTSKRWHLLFVVHGAESSRIAALQWSNSGRLFGASSDGLLWEVDLVRLRRHRMADSNGGPIWSLAINNDAEMLAAGCEDGRVRLYSFKDDDLYFEKGFVSTGSRIVSLAWHTSSNRLFSGSDQGIIHCWNANTMRNDARITLEQIGQDPCIVWTLAVLEDLTLVSGDSDGKLSFWDASTGTLSQQFSHLTADILALVASESKIYASGVDNQVAEYSRPEGASWMYSYSHRAHSHDVRALALSRGDRPRLVSAGIDTQLVHYPSNNFKAQRPFKIASSPHRHTLSLASEERVLLMQKEATLDLWRLQGDDEAAEQPLKLLELQVGDVSNIRCSALSPNAKTLACSTAKELKVFSLDNSFHPRKVKLLSSAAKQPAHALAFSPDSTRLVVATDAQQIHILDVAKNELLRSFDAEDENPSPILSLCVSLDGQWLATGDANNNLSVYNLDSMQLYCRLPRPNEMHTNMAFNPSGDMLVVTLASNSFVCYDIETKGLSEWYRSHREHFPKCLVDGRTVKGIAFNPANAQLLYLYSHTSLFQIDMSTSAAEIEASPKKSRKRQRSIGAESDGKNASESEVEASDGFCRIVNKYRPLAFVDFLGENEMVVVETPWLKVLSRLPGALQRHKYGK